MNDDDNLKSIISAALRKVPKATFRKIVSEHTTEGPRSIAAKTILDHIRLTGCDIVRVKPLEKPHSTHACKSLDKQ